MAQQAITPWWCGAALLHRTTTKTSMYDILVVGDLNADLVLVGEAEPRYGQVEQLLDDASLLLGSSAGIFACGAARLGLRVAFAGLVGDDDIGRMLLRELAANGVDTRYITVDPAVKTGLTVILSRRADRALLTYTGSIAALRYAHVAGALYGDSGRVAGRPGRSLRPSRSARHLHLGSFYMLDGLRPDVPRLFAEAKALGMSVSLDTNYDPRERWEGGVAEALAHVDVFLPNEAELRGIGRHHEWEVALERVAAQVPLVVVKRGEKGATARRGEQRLEAAAPQVMTIDATGAGDSFDAGFVYGYLAGWDLERSLRLACVCGALSTRAAGGTAAQPTLDEAVGTLDLPGL